MLVLGGTGWLGREIARTAVAQGDEVVCLARGESGSAPEGARLVTADRRMPGAYDALDGEWDEVVEISYDLGLVASALDALADRAAHWTLVSTVSVYARNDDPGADESAEVVEPQDLTQYPDAKVAAERATAERVGDRLLIGRPGLIVGPGDPTDRFGYWPARFSRGGRVLAPQTASRHVQVIDVSDLAEWIVAAGSREVTGTVNAVGAIHRMADFFGEVGDVAGFDGEIVELDDASLLANGVNYWSGPRSLPLWVPAEDAGFAQRDGSAFVATGGTLRPLRDTLERTLADELARGIRRSRRAGLSPDDEAAILR